MNSFEDSLGYPTYVGDRVVYNSSGKLATGIVHRITNNFIEIERERTKYDRYYGYTSPYAKVRDGAWSIVRIASL